jgi:hypothetical protein
MQDRFRTTAPFVPSEAAFNEQADRASGDKKQGLAGLFAAPTADPVRLSFDQKHFEQFLREDDHNNTAKRKR